MSYTPSHKKKESEVMESFMGALEFFAKLLLWVGLLATLVGAGFLIYYVILYSNGTPPPGGSDPKALIEIFRKVLTTGLLAFFIGSAYILWGEGWMEMIQIIVSVVFFLAPQLMTMVIPTAENAPSGIPMLALIAIRQSALGAGVVAVLVVLADVFIKIQNRFSQGMKADQLKYGKGIKEEVDRKNVFMGKCWQLPYCRKFVRDRCPIYHARRSCWREKVGCMCEEEVIKGAMENRTIPKDAVAAARYIPHNNKLTMLQKMERCRQCVIYNEHQKHKYRLFLPIVVIGFMGICALLWMPLMAVMHGLISDAEAVLKKAVIEGNVNAQIPEFLQQIILGSLCLVVLTYLLKLLEFFIFKLKI